MKIEQLTEVFNKAKWPELIKILDSGDYDKAAEFFLDNGATPRGAAKTWNSAKSYHGNKYSLTDLQAAIKKIRPEAEKNRPRNKSSDEGDEDIAVSYQTMGDLKGNQALHVKDGDSKGASLARKMSKKGDTNPVATLEKDSKRFNDVAKGILRRKELLKKDKDGTITREERKELMDLNNSTLEYREKNGRSKKAAKEYEEAKTAKEIESILDRHIKDGIRIDNRATVESILKKIRADKEVNGKEASNLILKVKRVFRNKNNAKDIEKLIDRAQGEINAGLNHIEEVDKVLNKYDNGEDINKEDLTSLRDELKRMLPVMKEEGTKDKGNVVYINTINKINSFLKKDKEPDIDDIEEILDDLSNYHTDLKKEARIRKRSIKEDILYNLQ